MTPITSAGHLRGGGNVPPPSPPPGPVSPIGRLLSAPSSVWNTPIPVGDPSDPTSASAVSELVAQTQPPHASPYINYFNFTAPLYAFNASTPRIPCVMNFRTGIASADQLNTDLFSNGIPMPPGAVPSAGGDSQITLYDITSDRVYETYHMHQLLIAPTLPAKAVVAVTPPAPGLAAGTYQYGFTCQVPGGGETCIGANGSLGSQGLNYPSPIVVASSGSAVQLTLRFPFHTQIAHIYRGASKTTLQHIGTIDLGTPIDAYGHDVLFVDDGSVTPGAAPPPTNGAVVTDHWRVDNAGKFKPASNPGYYRPLSTGGVTIEDPRWGVTAAKLPICQGLITFGDLQAGVIDHALQISYVDALLGKHPFPAQSQDGGLASSALLEGQQFQLDPTYDPTLQTSLLGELMCRAAQKYGLICNDRTASNVGFRGEDSSPYTNAGLPNPWTTTWFRDRSGAALSSGTIAKAFPWNRLRLRTMTTDGTTPGVITGGPGGPFHA